jgi:hypothetical protein
LGNAALSRYRNCYLCIDIIKHYQNAYEAIHQTQFQANNDNDSIVDNSFLINSTESFGNWYLPFQLAYILAWFNWAKRIIPTISSAPLFFLLFHFIIVLSFFTLGANVEYIQSRRLRASNLSNRYDVEAGYSP